MQMGMKNCRQQPTNLFKESEMARKRTVEQRQRMSAAQKKRYRATKERAAALAAVSPVEAIICAKKLVDATNGDVKMAAKIVETIGSIT